MRVIELQTPLKSYKGVRTHRGITTCTGAVQLSYARICCAAMPRNALAKRAWPLPHARHTHAHTCCVSRHISTRPHRLELRCAANCRHNSCRNSTP
eukprot:11751155-Alexandrium_andersonii.AAC.1